MNDKNNLKVLVVDDEKVIRDLLTRFLSLHFVRVRAVEDGLQAIKAAKQEEFKLVFLDIRMPNMDGLQTFAELKKINPDFICVFMTGYAVEMEMLDITRQPRVICFKKPFEDIKQMEEILNKALQEALIIPKKEKDKEERRAFARLDIELEVDYNLKQVQKSFNRSLSKNIAAGGIRLFTLEDLSPGTILELMMRFPGCNEILNATAKVTWSKKSEDKPNFYDTGVRFTEIDFSKFAGLLMNCGLVKRQ